MIRFRLDSGGGPPLLIECDTAAEAVEIIRSIGSNPCGHPLLHAPTTTPVAVAEVVEDTPEADRPDDLISVKQAADRIQQYPPTVYKAINRGHLRAYMVRGVTRVSTAEVDAHEWSNRKPPSEEVRPSPEWMRLHEAAKKADVTPAKLRYWIDCKLLECQVVGNWQHVRLVDVAKLIANPPPTPQGASSVGAPAPKKAVEKLLSTVLCVNGACGGPIPDGTLVCPACGTYRPRQLERSA